ncbi:MAG: HAMP domain-containing histidine kinase, partial [Chloroflexota bacterium]|nr:HAMP domain-containing histidine kinase [Chloroflexota bacterium]
MSELAGFLAAEPTALINLNAAAAPAGVISPKLLEATSRTPSHTLERTVNLLIWPLALLLVAWATAIVALGPSPVAGLSLEARVGVEAVSTFARLFGALVLFLLVMDTGSRRLRWVALGFLFLGVGSLVFGYLQPLMLGEPRPDQPLYASLMVASVSGVFFVLGLVPNVPPRFAQRAVLLPLAGLGVVGILVIVTSIELPPLIRETELQEFATTGGTAFRELTPWHASFSVIPLGLAMFASAGAVRHAKQQVVGTWLAVAMVLLAGAQLHNLLSPSIYSQLFTSANLLRLAFGAVVAIGGILELRRIAGQRSVLQTAEREYVRRLNDLAELKSDLTAMIAHELGSPIAAIRGWADVLSTGDLDSEGQAQALDVIRAETTLLVKLVADVRAVRHAEQEIFSVYPVPCRAEQLLANAAAFTRTLPGDHSFTWPTGINSYVLADQVRIGQVLRNLLGNAVTYSPDGTPVALRAEHRDGRLRIEVVDRGIGIHPDDRQRIFEKFGRGRDALNRSIPGSG